MIYIQKALNLKDKDCSKEELVEDTKSHIRDVTETMNFIAHMITERAPTHDHTKLDLMDEFYHALIGGHAKDTQWFQKHITLERHHLASYVHNDITIVDVVEWICDCVSAGLARDGKVNRLEIPNEVLQLAVSNTAELLKKNIEVRSDENILDSDIKEGDVNND